MVQVKLTEYNPNWKQQFLLEKTALSNLKGIKQIDHFGSTAIEGMDAKPIIDILLQIHDDCNLEELLRDIKCMGYVNDIYSIVGLRDPIPPILFMKGYNQESNIGNKVHLHIRYNDNADDLLFCNYLQQNSKKAKAYSHLKRQLALEFVDSPPEYASGKLGFVNSAKFEARNRLKVIHGNRYYFYPRNIFLRSMLKNIYDIQNSIIGEK